MGIRLYRDWWPGNRRYIYKASDVFAVLVTQQGFTNEGHSALRAQLRKILPGVGRYYLTLPRRRFNPAWDEQLWMDFTNYPCPSELARKPGYIFVERYSRDSIQYAARHARFCCPICGSGDNPLSDLEFSLPWDPDEQLICQRCWRGYVFEIEKLVDAIDECIKKLNKGIQNAAKRKRERIGHQAEARNQVAG